MPTAVITGYNSGIGSEAARLALKDGYTVWACDRTLGDPITSLAGPNCRVVELDVADPTSIQKLKQALGETPIDLLYNIAGVMVGREEDSRQHVSLESLQKTFAVNSFGPFLLAQALEDNILAAGSPRRLAVVSSRVGSIGDNSSGGSYSYRASKSAVNSFFRNLAVELKDKDVVVSILHPGITNTNLIPELKSTAGAVEAEVAASALWNIIRSRGIEDTGKFWHRDGYELVW